VSSLWFHSLFLFSKWSLVKCDGYCIYNNEITNNKRIVIVIVITISAIIMTNLYVRNDVTIPSITNEIFEKSCTIIPNFDVIVVSRTPHNITNRQHGENSSIVTTTWTQFLPTLKNDDNQKMKILDFEFCG
jgi:hypothetical protein